MATIPAIADSAPKVLPVVVQYLSEEDRQYRSEHSVDMLAKKLRRVTKNVFFENPCAFTEIGAPALQGALILLAQICVHFGATIVSIAGCPFIRPAVNRPVSGH
jgi:hypothetical protein